MRYIAKSISSNRTKAVQDGLWQLRQRLSGKEPTIKVWLRVDDPYSYLLTIVLPEMANRYQVSWQLIITSKLQQTMYPEAKLWQQNAWSDIALISQLYQIKPPAVQPKLTNETSATTAELLELQRLEGTNPNWMKVRDIFNQLWQQGNEQEAQLSQAQIHMLNDNDKDLAKAGHYLSATLKFNGTWYWGIDRLDHLESRLNQLGLSNQDKSIGFNKTYTNFCQPFTPEQLSLTNTKSPVVLYFSIRSPYSHLALERCIKLTEHYGVPLIIKPVIPMLMRGLPVPKTKKFYIFHDTKREANKLGIDYGFVADPLGAGVERCYALFEYAKQEGKAIDYLLSYSRGVNAEGIMSETDRGLRLIVERAGLSWQKAKAILQDDSQYNAWREWAQEHQNELQQLGQWGVPTMRYEDNVVWGQDRIWVIEKAIRQAILR